MNSFSQPSTDSTNVRLILITGTTWFLKPKNGFEKGKFVKLVRSMFIPEPKTESEEVSPFSNS